MVSNEGIITTFGTTGTLGWLDDGTDKMHTGLIKALWQTATGSRVVSSGTLTQSGARFTLATPVVYRTEGSKVTLAGNNYVDIDDGYTDNDRYDLIYIDAGSDALAVSKGDDLATPQVKDINKDDVPVAIVKVTSGSTAASSTYEFQVLMSTFDKDELNDDEVTYAKIQNIVNDERVLGRVSGANGVIEELTQAQVLTFLGNPLQDGDFTSEGLMKRGSTPGSYSIDSSTYLTAESDTLDTVTGRGATTANNLNLNGVINLGNDVTHNKNASPHSAATLLTLGATMIYLDDATGTAQLPDPNSHTDKVVTIKNVNATTMSITPLVGTIDNGVINHDKRVTVANTIKLLQGESVTVQAIADGGITGGPTTVTQGWYIADTDTFEEDTTNDLLDDTSPQLGGNLDVNGNKITSASNGDVEIEPNGTGDIILDGDVTVDTGHTFSSTRLPTVSVSASTTLTEATHAGRYLICAGNVTLPSSSSAGEHYTILNTTSGDITVGNNSNDINGSAGSITVGTYNAVTCIAIGSNDWIALGV